MEVPDEIAMESERTETHRLFYVDHDYSSNNEENKIAVDSQNMLNIIRALRQINTDTNYVFGVFGEKISLGALLYSLFPNDHTRINSMFAAIDPMPAIWTVHNSTNFVFLLLSTDDTTSENENYFIVVMQRLLQDICQNILICPSETFFLNFSVEHSFHGRPHETRTYQQVKIERADVEPPEKIKLDDKNILKSLLDEQYRNILITNNTQNTYCVQKKFQDPNQNTENNKLDKVKELLQTQIDTSNLSMRSILKVFEQSGIFLSKNQKTQMENNFTAHTKVYEQEKKNAVSQANALVKDLLGITNKSGSFSSASVEVDSSLKKQLYTDTTDWLINPKRMDETANHFTSRLTSTIYSYKSNKNRNMTIGVQQIDYFTNGLLRYDKKEKMRQSQENFIKFILLIVQSESQFEVHYNIHRVQYNPSIDTEKHLQCLTVSSSAPVQISLNDLAPFMNLSDLSKSDRLDFSKRIELIACFKMNDGNSEIITIKRPHIMNKGLSPESGYTVLLHKSGIFRKVTDFYLSNIYVTYAFNQNSNTLVVYNIDMGNVTRCSLDEFGQLRNNPVLHLNDRSKKPNGVKSMALTVAQDLLILIDSSSNVYNLDISGETSLISLLSKTTNNSNEKPDFVADNGDLYQTVQTIGEKNPVFFFQAQSCIDIVDQNYSQIYSIKLNQHSPFCKMQIFTDFVDTYCILFNTSATEVYYIQNLISDTRIERQESSNDLEKLGKQYIGNRLLDIIKRGEVQFGVSDSLHESQYFFVLLFEYSAYSDRIKKYFKDLNVRAQLKIGYEKTDLMFPSIDIEQLIKIVVSRVPLQLCTIEMGTLVPLNNGRRDIMDHLSSKSFRIEMKAREISFSYLDNVLNDINNNIKIVGVIGRQSTGKSYLMNKIFRTRFSVAAGRCTDGIWMSYAFLENTHFIILDCEGLFSDQRAEDEEIKLISFLAAVCDITILSQDLGFSRFQDRLFDVLSQAVDKIGKNDKLFKGVLLVAVRDISDSNANESVVAAEKKFFDLQKKGKSGFLEQLFSDTYKIQLLHHFENRNFDYEIQKLRQISIKHVLTDKTTGLQLPCRWENGKDLADRLKILLVQLYTDDFIDSNEIHADMKLSELEEEMKKAWTKFDLNDEENNDSKEQHIEKIFDDKPYSLKLNHVNLELNDNVSENNFENICEFILTQLRSITGLSYETKEENNKIFSFVNELISDVMSYRRQQVEIWILESFDKKFPNKNEHINERKTKFMKSIEQYMLAFELQVCLKKCSFCDLKCISNAQHTEETKAILKKKKDELIRFQALLKTPISKNSEDRIKKLNEDILVAKTKENNLHQEMVRLSSELKHLYEKEKIETNIMKYDFELIDRKAKIDSLTQKINEIHTQLQVFLPSEVDRKDIDELLRNLDSDVIKLANPDQYMNDHLNKLIEKFHENYETDCTLKHELFCFSIKPEQMDKAESTSDLQLNTSLLSKMMTDNINNIHNYREFIQQCLKRIQEQLHNEQQYVKNHETRMTEIEQQIADAEKQKEDITKLIEATKIEREKLDQQLSEINIEHEPLTKELNEEDQSVNTTASSESKKIENYLKDLQDKLTICDSLDSNNNEIDRKRQQEDVKLEYFVIEKMGKEADLAARKKEISSLNDDIRIKELEEQVNKDEQAITALLEKIDNVQKKIKSSEEEQLLLQNRQNQKQQLSEELKEVNQLMTTIHSYDQQIESERVRLLKVIRKKNLKEEHIEKLKEAEADDIEEEEKHLKELNDTIEHIQTTLTNIKQEKASVCENNTLLIKILNNSQCNIYERQKNIRERLDELSERSKHLNENIEQMIVFLSSEENKLKDQNQEILNMKQTFDLQKADLTKYINSIQIINALNEVGIELFQSLSEAEKPLIDASEKLNKIIEAKRLIQEHALSSDELTVTTNEQNHLETVRSELNRSLDTMKSNDYTCRYTNTQECQKQYDMITKEHDSAHLHTNKLEQELSDIDVYSHLKEEVTNLEREVQKDCSCGTDHKCSGICRICSQEDATKQNNCMFLAGHAGDHKCDGGHVCTKFCQICETYGLQKNSCRFSYEHTEPAHHQCERTHQCPATCVCSDPCAIPLGLQQHEEHRCNKTGCWKQCIFSCGNLCAVDDHNHDTTAEPVSITIGNDIHQTKKHLCNQPHYCKGICNTPGVCKQEYKPQPRKWRTESGIEFPYDHIEVEEVRAKCEIKIGINKYSHDESKYHQCSGQHTCPERCPDCGSFCRNNIGHDGHHKTMHRNKDQHIFTSTNPTEKIEIRSTEQEENNVRIYKIGESATPENCSVSCKHRGRSHFHLVECPGGLRCWGKVLGNKAKHSDNTYYYGLDNPSTKKFDQILCSVYWSLNKWYSPVNDADRKLIDSCNTYCEKHIERDKNGNIAKESVKGFCTLDAWHTGNHVFECQTVHQLLDMYQGVDVCFVIDSTESMEPYFEKVKQTIASIIKNNQELMKKLGKSTSDFQFAIVDYRDHPPEGDYLFHACDFTTDVLASAYVANLKSGSGGDFPEAVLDGLDAACTLKWRDKADRLLFHILDAPPHGKMYHSQKDDKWPNGCPCNKTAEIVLQVMKKKNIIYHVLHCSNFLNMMITEFKKHIDVKTLTFDDKITFENVITKQVYQQLADTEMTLKKS